MVRRQNLFAGLETHALDDNVHPVHGAGDEDQVGGLDVNEPSKCCSTRFQSRDIVPFEEVVRVLLDGLSDILLLLKNLLGARTEGTVIQIHDTGTDVPVAISFSQI